MKKFSLILATFGLVLFSACGDDSSSGVTPENPASSDSAAEPASSDSAVDPASSDALLPTSSAADLSSSDSAADPASSESDYQIDEQGRKVFSDENKILNAECSSENKCEIIIYNDSFVQDTLQCDGSMFKSIFVGSALDECATESASSAAVVPASSDAVIPASSASEPAGDVVSCLMEGAFMGETIKTCAVGAAGSAYEASIAQNCVGLEGVLTATIGTSCPAGFVKECAFDDHTVYLYNEDETCEANAK